MLRFWVIFVTFNISFLTFGGESVLRLRVSFLTFGG